jgi:DNA-binding IclR family transcriptional regulator
LLIASMTGSAPPIAVSGADGSRSQTLDRGLTVLELVAESSVPLTLSELAQHTGLHRSIVYRLLRTLRDHRLIARTSDERYTAGLGLIALTRGLATDLRSVASPELASLANDLGMTAFVVVRDGDDALTLTAVEPVASSAHVTYRPGTRHPIARGAPGLALLMSVDAEPGERAELRLARRVGWSRTSGEVLAGLSSIATPLPGRHDPTAAVAVVFAGPADEEAVGVRVVAAARRIAARLP